MNTTCDFIKEFGAETALKEEAAPNKNTRLPGLHLTSVELLEGIQYAAQSNTQGSCDFLMALGQVWDKTIGGPSPSMPEIEQAIQTGRWRPSWDELFAVGLTWDALDFMPVGIASLAIGGKEVPVQTNDLQKTLGGLAELSHEDAVRFAEVVGPLVSKFGATVMDVRELRDESGEDVGLEDSAEATAGEVIPVEAGRVGRGEASASPAMGSRRKRPRSSTSGDDCEGHTNASLELFVGSGGSR